MAWWKPWDRTPRSTELVVQQPQSITALALTAAAQVVSAPSVGARRIVPKYATWQDELWDYYESLGEFNIAVTWRSYMMSRVRLRAARIKPGSDEPEIVDVGPAADFVNELFNDASSQSEMLGTISVHMDVPAECWLVGEVSSVTGKNKWRIVSSDEIRQRGRGYEIISEDSMMGNEQWRPLSDNSYVTRVWKPHKRKHYLPYSQAYAARGAMRELELVNRHITAQYLSRLASAGIVIFPDEIQFPVRPEFQDEADPFLREWIEIAAESIKTPGSAAAMIPMPIRIPSDLVDKVKHIDFTVRIDERIIEKRDSARNRLATMINVPAELLFQAADVNHWSLWQLEEGAIRTYISGDAEIIVGALTRGYLHPRLRAAGVSNFEEWVVWYDTSELSIRPDKSDNATLAYDRLEIDGQAYRRELGFDEDDAPNDDELAGMILRKLISQPNNALLALHELTGIKLEQPAPAPPPGFGDDPNADPNADPEDDDEAESSGAQEQGPPKTRESQPPRPEDGSASTIVKSLVFSEWSAFARLQARSQHIIEVDPLGKWQLKHPLICQPKLFSCPFTHVTHAGITAYPGRPGTYACHLSADGDIRIGEHVSTGSESYIPTSPGGLVNGTRHGA
jgi:hypothetical protein